MSYSGVGGFQGNDALLAYAAIQQGRMNEEISDSMRIADLRSQMAGELADIKAHLHSGILHPAELIEVDKEMQAFLEKYGDEPALQDVVSTVRGIQENIHGQVKIHQELVNQVATGSSTFSGYEPSEGGLKGTLHAASAASIDALTPEFQAVTLAPLDYADKTIPAWIDQISEKLDASGTNDQLQMIRLKQLNDNINNSSGTVSGIIESRNNAISSIINNIA